MQSAEKIDRKVEFETQGYTICRNFFSDEEIAELGRELRQAQVDGDGTLSKTYMKFYSNTFYRSSFMQSFISQKKIVDFIRDIVGPNIWVRWDQAVEKKPGGELFPWHQDNGYSSTKEPYYQFWIALTDMTRENGGIWLQPGSHKHGVLPHKMVDNHLVCDTQISEPVFIEAKKGDIMLFSSFMLHRTLPNTSTANRWAYVIEYMSLEHYDPFIEPPYFIAARNGEPSPEFVRFDQGWWSPKNQVKYALPVVKSVLRKSPLRAPFKQLESMLAKR